MDIKKICEKYGIEEPGELINLSTFPPMTLDIPFHNLGLKPKKSLKLTFIESLNKIDSLEERFYYLEEAYNCLLSLSKIISLKNPTYTDFYDFLSKELEDYETKSYQRSKNKLQKKYTGEATSFFESVKNGEYESTLDMVHKIDSLTNHFNPQKLKYLCNDFDIYLIKQSTAGKESQLKLLMDRKKGLISEQDFQKKLKKHKTPVLLVSDFLGDKKKLENKLTTLREDNSKTLSASNVEMQISELRRLLVKLYKEHINNELQEVDISNKKNDNLKSLAEQYCNRPHSKYNEDEVLFILKKADKLKQQENVSALIRNIQSDEHCPDSIKDKGKFNHSNKHVKRQRKVITFYDKETGNKRK